jgi:5'(3')-deoxyribonucleotidase
MKDLFLDFDGTIVNAIKAVCEVYNFMYRLHPDFVEADWTKCDKWNFSDVCPLLKNCNDIFSSKKFFDVCELMDKYTYDTLKKLNGKYHIIVCSIGTPDNISYKIQWLKNHLPFISDYNMIVNNHSNGYCKMNKRIANMQDAIFMDDVPNNLRSSNAKVKILFGKTYSWNKDWTGLTCSDWNKVNDIL